MTEIQVTDEILYPRKAGENVLSLTRRLGLTRSESNSQRQTKTQHSNQN